jgi:hypothetical protein
MMQKANVSHGKVKVGQDSYPAFVVQDYCIREGVIRSWSYVIDMEKKKVKKSKEEAKEKD